MDKNEGDQKEAPKIIEEYMDDYALLIETGFIAAKQLDEISATRIFQAAQAINPNSTAPRIGLGHIALSKLETKQATRIFKDVLAQEPDNHLAKCFLGICYLLTKDKMKKGEALLREAQEATDDPTVKNLAVVSLDWAEKDLYKKQKTAFYTKQKVDPEDDEE